MFPRDRRKKGARSGSAEAVMDCEQHQWTHSEIMLTDKTTIEKVGEMTSVIEKMTGRVIVVASIYGALEKRIEILETFLHALSSSIDSGIGRLVDADMNEASTRLKAIQSLSIANTNAENVTQLFR